MRDHESVDVCVDAGTTHAVEDATDDGDVNDDSTNVVVKTTKRKKRVLRSSQSFRLKTSLVPLASASTTDPLRPRQSSQTNVDKLPCNVASDFVEVILT